MVAVRLSICLCFTLSTYQHQCRVVSAIGYVRAHIDHNGWYDARSRNDRVREETIQVHQVFEVTSNGDASKIADDEIEFFPQKGGVRRVNNVLSTEVMSNGDTSKIAVDEMEFVPRKGGVRRVNNVLFTASQPQWPDEQEGMDSLLTDASERSLSRFQRGSMQHFDASRPDHASHLSGGRVVDMHLSSTGISIWLSIAIFTIVVLSILSSLLFIKNVDYGKKLVRARYADGIKFDYEALVADLDASLFWRWCGEQELINLGVELRSEPQGYLEFIKLEVQATEDAVEEVLEQAGADTAQLKEDGSIEAISWKLLRTECFFMTSQLSIESSAQTLILMGEVVDLRLLHFDRVLIQKPDTSWVGSEGCLPVIEKLSNESPIAAARRYWVQILKMPEISARFIEDDFEDRDAHPYGEVRCVERVYHVIIHLVTNDPQIIKTIGLPGYTEFAVEGDEQSLQLSFEWMIEEEYADMGVTVEPVELFGVIEARSIAPTGPTGNLERFLKRCKVDYSLWRGEDFLRSITDLHKELLDGQCSLMVNTKGALYRLVNVVAVRLHDPRHEYLLVQVGRSDQSGYSDTAVTLPGYKQRVGESVIDCAKCALRERVCLRIEDVNFAPETTWEYTSYVEESRSFPGLTTKYSKYFVDAVVNDMNLGSKDGLLPARI